MQEDIQKTELSEDKQTPTPTNKTEDKPWRFQPGQSGNPNGRPPGKKNLDTLFKDAFTNIATKLKKTADNVETEVIETVIVKAQNGSPKHIEIFMKYRYGNPVTPIDLSVKTEDVAKMTNLFTKLLNKDNPDQESVTEDDVDYTTQDQLVESLDEQYISDSTDNPEQTEEPKDPISI